jgi:hypothetical protein
MAQQICWLHRSQVPPTSHHAAYSTQVVSSETSNSGRNVIIIFTARLIARARQQAATRCILALAAICLPQEVDLQFVVASMIRFLS